MMQTPARAIAEPKTSQRSGLSESSAQPHKNERTMKKPPYAAYVRPNGCCCRVGIMP
eukprot:Gb_29480 [translate_table: standard]